MKIYKILSSDDASVPNEEVEGHKRGLRWTLLLLATLCLFFITYKMIKLALYILVHIDMIESSKEQLGKIANVSTGVTRPRYVSSPLDGSTKGFLMGS